LRASRRRDDRGTGRDEPIVVDAASAGQADRLTFDDPAVEAEYRADYYARTLGHIRLSMVLGMSLYALWGLVDWYTVPEAVARTWVIRYALACPVTLAALGLSYTRWFERWMTPALTFVSAVGGFGMVAIVAESGPLGHLQFYAGLILCAMFFCTCPGLGFRATTIIVWADLIAYEAVARLDPTATAEVLLNNTMFLVATNALAMMTSFALERQARADFLHRKIIGEQTAALRAALGEVEARRAEAEHASRTDPLTGLANRRHFFDVAAAAGAREAIILLDVDHFKAINDRFGHAVGDRVLQAIADRIRANVRPGDVACRFGGEEFAVLLPGADLGAAATVGERLRTGIEAAAVETDAGPLGVTVSVGIATEPGPSPSPRADLDALIDRADRALYQAKHHGRNRVRLWHPDDALAQVP
jgi:diguanylate cyclase (GGDEF)-like protein